MPGITSKKQPENLPVMVGGSGTSGLQDTEKDGDERLSPAVSMAPQDGDNPSFSQSVPGPSGADLRVKSGGSVTNPHEAMPGA